jgi:hypothetical protein
VNDLRIPIRIVFYQEEGVWIAHCLEFDLIGDGSTQKEAMECLEGAIAAQVEASIKYKNLANLFTPAEGKYMQMFAAGRNILRGEVRLKPLHIDSIYVDHAEIREYVGDLEYALA